MDQIDSLAGLKPLSEVYRARRERPEFVEGADACRKSVLAPQNSFGLSHALRAALSARMARLIGQDGLVEAYLQRLAQAGSDAVLDTIAAGAMPQAVDAGLAAIIRHADLVTQSPRDATKGDIEKLEAAGLSNPDIVTLSELIAFINFEARVIIGLQALERVA